MSENFYQGEREKIYIRRLTGKDFRFFLDMKVGGNWTPESIYSEETLTRYIDRIEGKNTIIKSKTELWAYLQDELSLADFAKYAIWLMEQLTAGMPKLTEKNSASSPDSQQTKKGEETSAAATAKAFPAADVGI